MAQRNRRAVGEKWEALAEQYLTDKGLHILERNYYFKGGEIDLIAADGEYLCFIEVKYRKTEALGFPEEAVGRAKQRKLLLGARHYLYEHQLPEFTPCRFDVIAILGQQVTWIQDAFC